MQGYGHSYTGTVTINAGILQADGNYELLANSWLNVAEQAQILFQSPMDERWPQSVALSPTGMDSP